MAKKTSCPISRAQFRGKAKPIAVAINGKEYNAVPKEFSTGSLGWNINDKVQIDIDGVLVTVQIGMNLTVVGSKDLPQDAGSTATAEAG
jgi:hypothetical protein